MILSQLDGRIIWTYSSYALNLWCCEQYVMDACNAATYSLFALKSGRLNLFFLHICVHSDYTKLSVLIFMFLLIKNKFMQRKSWQQDKFLPCSYLNKYTNIDYTSNFWTRELIAPPSSLNCEVMILELICYNWFVMPQKVDVSVQYMQAIWNIGPLNLL
jgi:hypothetical protein